MDSQARAQAGPGLAALAPSRVASFCLQPAISQNPRTFDDSGIRDQTYRHYRYMHHPPAGFHPKNLFAPSETPRQDSMRVAPDCGQLRNP